MRPGSGGSLGDEVGAAVLDIQVVGVLPAPGEGEGRPEQLSAGADSHY